MQQYNNNNNTTTTTTTRIQQPVNGSNINHFKFLKRKAV